MAKGPFFEEIPPIWQGSKRTLVVGTQVAPKHPAVCLRNVDDSCRGGTQVL